MKKILMLGPSRDVKGGMTSVVDSYYDGGIEQRVELKYIETVNDKNALLKIIKMIKGFIDFLINIGKYDVVHIHMASRLSSFRKGLYVRISKKKKKKVIVHVHGAEYKIFYENECNEKKKKYVRKTFELADKVIVLSEEWKEFFKNIVDENKIEVIYNAISLPEDFKKNLDTKNILFLGRFGHRKGIYDLIDVIERIKRIYPDIHLYAGGDGEVDEVKKIVDEKNLNNNFTYLGWINGEEKEKYLRESSYYILPSYNEGMPMSLIEGMAYKNISISTNVGGIPKVINNMENGIIIKPGDKEALYENLEKLFNDKKLRQKISTNARKVVEEKFNINTNIEKLLELYNI